MMLHNALDRAVKERLILRNPTEDCIIPKIERQEMKILQPEDMRAYLQAADRRGVLPMFYLELVSGIRKGELVPLLWADQDPQRRTISISKQAAARGGKILVSRPKTETSVRKISIPQEAVELLRREHEKHPQQPLPVPLPLTGEMYHPDSVVNLHKKILREAGLPDIRFHDLRHTFATHALAGGVDAKTLSGILGHTKASFTLDTYAHVTGDMQRHAAKIVGGFIADIL